MTELVDECGVVKGEDLSDDCGFEQECGRLMRLFLRCHDIETEASSGLMTVSTAVSNIVIDKYLLICTRLQ